jgi:8-oxo-dGTP pyrophosphatase MutT (NUDIX family)
MPLATFAAFHEVPEGEHARIGKLEFAVVIAHSRDGEVLVFNRYRHVWELPGGFIGADESPRDTASRELAEEAGCASGEIEWLGVVEVDDGLRHLGAVFGCDVDDVPEVMDTEEIGGIAFWRRGDHPQPLGDSDTALLERLGGVPRLPG